jgi:hypothetical protein
LFDNLGKDGGRRPYYLFDRKKELIELSCIHEGDECWFNEEGIYYDPKDDVFCWIGASGCSCWDGEYGENNYNTLEETIAAIREAKLNDGEELIEEALFVWKDIQSKYVY